MDLLIRLLIWLIRELLGANQPDAPALPQPADAPETSLERSLSRLDRRLSSVEEAAQSQLKELESSEADLQARLKPVLEQGVLTRIGALREERHRLTGTIREAGSEAAFESAQSYAHAVGRLEVLVQVTQEMLRQRRSEADRAVLGDADALAAACYSPVLEFAHRHQLPIASNHPMTVFYPGGTFIELAFLEEQLAPIGLPESYRTEPWRWPAIAHEIAHDLYVSLPDLEPELVSKLGLELTKEANLVPGTDDFNRLLFRVWLAEIFADAVGALMIGPAYLRAMAAIFRSPDDPRQVVTIPVTEEGIIAVHPPRHLRVHMTAHFLSRMGFTSEVRSWVESWDEEHGEPDHALLAVARSEVEPMTLAPLLELGRSLTDRLYHTESRALAGHRLADVPGLDFSSLHVRRAEKAKPRLAAGQPVAFDARAVIAAATEAALEAPERVAQINEATRLSIVGIGTAERPARVRALAAGSRRAGRSPRSRAAQSRRFIEALLLEEILEGGPRRSSNLALPAPAATEERR